MTDQATRERRVSLRAVAVVLVFAITVAGWLWLGSQRPAKTTVVATTRAMPAYTIINSASITTTTTTAAPADAITDPAAVEGRITAKSLAPNTALTAATFISTSQSLADRWLLTVPVTSTFVPAPGETVVLLGTSEDVAEATVLSQEAVVVGMEEAYVLIAVPHDEAQQAAGYLGAGRRLQVIRRVKP